MEWIDTIIALVNGCGFPVAAFLIMVFLLNKEQEQHEKEAERFNVAITNNTLVLQKLLDKLEGR